DLTLAIEIGMVLAAFLFMRKMIQFTEVSIVRGREEGDPARGSHRLPTEAFYGEGAEFADNEETDYYNKENATAFVIPAGVQVFEVPGPLCFGAAYKFRDAMKLLEKPPRVLIIRMRRVPLIDATGIKTIEEIFKASKKQGTRVILSEVLSSQVHKEL